MHYDSAPRRLVRDFHRDVDLHVVAEHHAAAFDRTVPLHTVIKPVHGRAGFEAESLATVALFWSPRKCPVKTTGLVTPRIVKSP